MKNKVIAAILLLLFFNIYSSAYAQTISDENDYIKAVMDSKELHSRLGEMYTGYDCVIKNVYNKPVTIQNITIWDNANSTVAYLSVKRTSEDTAKSTIAAGKPLALPTLGLSMLASTAAVPFTLIGNKIGNSNAQKEAKHYDKIMSAKTTLEPNEQVTIKTMALKKYIPYVRITFLNPLTEENMVLELKK